MRYRSFESLYSGSWHFARKYAVSRTRMARNQLSKISTSCDLPPLREQERSNGTVNPLPFCDSTGTSDRNALHSAIEELFTVPSDVPRPTQLKADLIWHAKRLRSWCKNRYRIRLRRSAERFRVLEDLRRKEFRPMINPTLQMSENVVQVDTPRVDEDVPILKELSSSEADGQSHIHSKQDTETNNEETEDVEEDSYESDRMEFVFLGTHENRRIRQRSSIVPSIDVTTIDFLPCEELPDFIYPVTQISSETVDSLCASKVLMKGKKPSLEADKKNKKKSTNRSSSADDKNDSINVFLKDFQFKPSFPDDMMESEFLSDEKPLEQGTLGEGAL